MAGQGTGDFWARRRAAVAEESRALETARQVEEEARLDAERAAEQADKPDDELLADLGLPDPDSLKAGDDFTAFMGKAVPDHLRRRALRRLWVSDPVLANVDGLLEYGEDFTASPQRTAIKTAYQVGKGLMAHVRAVETQDEATEEPAADMLAEVEIPEPAPVALRSVEADEMPPTEDIQDHSETPPAAPARRHMRFSYHE